TQSASGPSPPIVSRKRWARAPMSTGGSVAIKPSSATTARTRAIASASSRLAPLTVTRKGFHRPAPPSRASRQRGQLLGDRLLREPPGFEGFLFRPVLPALHDQSIAQLVDEDLCIAN